MYTFTYQKILHHTLLLLAFKIVKSHQCILQKNEAETLRQNVSNVLKKSLNLKIRSNVTKEEQKALKKLTGKNCVLLNPVQQWLLGCF